MKIGYKALIENAEKEIETLDAGRSRSAAERPERRLRRSARSARTHARRQDPRRLPRAARHARILGRSGQPVSQGRVFVRQTLVFYCQSGWRSALATQTVQRMGLENVCHIGGGFSAWKAAGSPVEAVKKD